MKKLILIFLALFNFACASAPQPKMSWDEAFKDQETVKTESSSSMIHDFVFRSVPPKYLSLMATGVQRSADSILNDPTTNSKALGWFTNGYPDNTGAAYIGYQFGDTATGLISRFGKQMQMYAYHGLDIDIGETGTIPPNPTVNNGLTITLHVAATDIKASSGTSGNITLVPGSGGLIISNPSTSGVGAITWMGALSNTVTTTSVPAQSCSSVLLGTLTGAAVNSSCEMGDSNTSGSTSSAIQSTCYVSAANTVQIHACNVTTSAANVSGTFKARVMNY